MDEIAALFELAPEEIEVCLRLKGPGGRHELLHYLRPPAFDDWREYERNLRSTVESVENDGEETLRFATCALEAAAMLYDRLFRRAQGYQAGPAVPLPSASLPATPCDSAAGQPLREGGTGRTSDGGSTAPLDSAPFDLAQGRRDRLATSGNGVAAERIPLHHKELVVRGLSDVAPAAPANSADEWEALPFALDAETVEVRLEATRAGDKYANLVHVFRPPSAAERVEHSRIHAQALFVRGSSRDGGLKSLLPSRLPGLVALYDRLILEARGYAAAGRPLADRAAVVRHMDPLHKKVAVQALFEE